jgi:hypothetical protein
MDRGHLTEFEIQSYLDTGSDELTEKVETHILSCRECRASVNLYRSLYDRLCDESGFTLPRDFSKTIVKAVGLEVPRPWYADLGLYGILAAVAAVLIASFVYMTDFASLPDSSAIWAAVVNWSSVFRLDYMKSIQIESATIGKFVHLLVPGIIALATMWFLDRHVIRARRRPSSLVI